MKATIYHNPRCSKSRAALAILEAAGAEVTVIDYLQTPPTADELARLYARAGLTPRQGLRVDAPEIADGAILATMAVSPAIIERPLVETDMGVVLARPPERVRDIMPAAQAGRNAPRWFRCPTAGRMRSPSCHPAGPS